MFWITKYRHNKIVDQYQKTIDDLREALWRKEKFEQICDKLADKTLGHGMALDTCIGSVDVMSCLDDSVPRYVEDYFGGKCIKQ